MGKDLEQERRNERLAKECFREVIGEMPPEEYVWATERGQLQKEAEGYFAGLMQRLDEDGQQLLQKYRECCEDRMFLEKRAAFLDGCVAIRYIGDLFEERIPPHAQKAAIRGTLDRQKQNLS